MPASHHIVPIPRRRFRHPSRHLPAIVLSLLPVAVRLTVRPTNLFLTIAAVQAAARPQPTRNFEGSEDSRAAGYTERHLQSAS